MRTYTIGLVAVACCAGGPALAQQAEPSCGPGNGGTSCTVAAGSYSQPLQVTAGALAITNDGTFEVNLTGQSYVLNFFSQGVNGGDSTSGDATSGGGVGFLSAGNNGSVGASGTTSASSPFHELFMSAQAGNGGSYTNADAKHDAGAGGEQNGGPFFSNTAPVTLSADLADGGSAVLLAGFAGNGGNVAANGDTDDFGNPEFNGSGNGGDGGNTGAGGGVTAVNSAAIAVGNAAQALNYEGSSAGGLGAISVGGAAGLGSGSAGGAQGGSGGAVALTNGGPVSVYLAYAGSGTPPATWGVFAQSSGGNGQPTYTENENGGAGGAAGEVTATINAGGDILLSRFGNVPTPGEPFSLSALMGSALDASSAGGNGGSPYASEHEIGANPIVNGGAGGPAGAVTVKVTDAQVAAAGDYLAGIEAESAGGAGGNGNYTTASDAALLGGNDGNGGAGGLAGSVAVNLSSSATVETAGVLAPGVLALSAGGAGGPGANFSSTFGGLGGGDGGNGGGGGGAGSVSVALNGFPTVSTTGAQSAAIVALALGGAGGIGGDHNGGTGNPGAGGAGGAAGGVTVTVNGGIVSAAAAQSPGIVALSSGGVGGSAGSSSTTVGGNGTQGGSGGASGIVSVTNGATIETCGPNQICGPNSPAIVATSASGAGGAGGDASGVIVSTGGAGGAGGEVGQDLSVNGQPVLTAVEVTNAGSVLTYGGTSAGIIAQALSGGGGGGGSGNALFSSSGGNGGSAGPVGAIGLSNPGSIATNGAYSDGILAQSVGGGGGAGGGSTEAISSLGGAAAFSASGGTVTIENGGLIQTLGDYSPAILAQSVGGGGGDGGSSQGLVAIGGSGGGGGAGGDLTITLGGAGGVGGELITEGYLSAGALAQSIGGGGGNAGDARGVDVGFGLAIGGSGGGGGNGGAATINGTAGTLTTTGSKAVGILAQSIGGGGGTGGAAYSEVVNEALSVGVAVGGKGGDGGAGGAASVTASNITISTGQSPYLTGPAGQTPTSNGPDGTGANTSNAAPVDAYGIVVQSIGGGGGLGGSALAASGAIPVPVPGTEIQVGGAVSVAVGGSGGSGGSGGASTINLATGTTLTTYGQGSDGVLAQSIGGGGGVGGDSSASAATIGYGRAATAASQNVWTGDVAVAVGGSGGVAGGGGPTVVAIGGSGNTPRGPAKITTFGDYADGVLAQSIGGGGGNAGFGSTSTLNFGSARNLSVGVSVGAGGTAGGNGGAVSVTEFPGSTVGTYGSGAVGLLAQSIGGGGGTSQGGAIDLGASFTTAGEGFNCGLPTCNESAGGTASLRLGGSGSGGGNGATVTALVEGAIATQGGDATGVLAESIGGGGGLAGGAGSDASADNPVSPQSLGKGLVAAREFVSNAAEQTAAFTESATLSVGGTNGASGAGGAVDVTNEGQISTLGDWAGGIVAQSIGGGGGKGGTAVSLAWGVRPTITLTIGNRGNGGGNGGTTSVALAPEPGTSPVENSGITTRGYAAFGVLAQSIGGGGGFGADGSTSANGAIAVGGSASGSGGEVLLSANGGGVVTTGEDAAAVVLQSIGGGGGGGGNGSSLSAANNTQGSAVSLAVGGGTSSSGSGGAISTGGTDLAITTSGTNAYGLLAQSIGGGGGLGFTQQAGSTTLGGNVPTGGANGSAVTLNVDGLIFTKGLGSHAIVAQSIGGGGGIAQFPTAPPPGYAPTPPTLSTTPPTNHGTSGNGGEVSVEASAEIETLGAGAFGILAQSIGAGGGLLAQGSTVYAGSTGTENLGSGGTVSVTENGSITTRGENSVGIFAQSATSTANGCCGGGSGNSVTVTVNGLVNGGSGAQGAGVWVADGTEFNVGNLLTVGPQGFIGAISGRAITYTGPSGLDVINNGTLRGSSSLGSGTLTNNGTLQVAGAAGPTRYYGAARLQGNLVQSTSGRIETDVDFAARRAGYLVVTGNAALGGKIVPNPATILPNIAVPVLIVDGTMSGTIQGSHSTLFAYDAHDPPSEITLSARALGFAPAGFGITGEAAQVADYLGPVFDTASTPELGTLFATLGNLADNDPGAYRDALHQLAPRAVLAFASRARRETTAFGDALLNCESFVGASAILTPEGCGWMAVSGGAATQDGGGGYAGFTDSTVNYRVGGQAAVAPGWLVGGALGYSHSWLEGAYGTTGEGDAGYAGVALTREWRGWRFSGALLGGAGWNTTNRLVSVPGFESVLKGQPSVDTEEALARADYTFGIGKHAYVRPSVTIGVVRVHAGPFEESGERTVGLDFGSAATVSGVFAPEVEFGFRSDLADAMALRSYVRVGASLPTTSMFHQPVRLEGAALGAGSFEAAGPTDGTAATLELGVQLFAADGFSAKLAYDGAFSGRVTENAGMLRGTLHF